MKIDELRVRIEKIVAFHCVPGTFDGCNIDNDTKEIALCSNCGKLADAVMAEILSLRQARDTAEQELRKAERIIELERRAYERLELCPDHRDKVSGRCIVCQAEERTKQEQLAAVDAERIALQQEVEELRATIGTLDAL